MITNIESYALDVHSGRLLVHHRGSGLGSTYLVVAQKKRKKKHIKVAACLVELKEHEAQTPNNPVQQSVLLLSALCATSLW